MQEMFVIIAYDITNFFCMYAPAGFVLALLASFLYGFGLVLRGRINASISSLDSRSVVKKSLLFFLLVWYFYIVLGITILSRSESGNRRASFELFRTFQNTFTAKKMIYENVIMFIPLAMLLYTLDVRFQEIRIMLLIGVLGSLLIEATQWMTKTGFFEVDDILTNTVGMLLGFVICVVGQWLYEKLRRNV